MISGIIKVEESVISLSLQLRLITLTSTLIIPDITKTESNNCLLSRQEGKFRHTTSRVGTSSFSSVPDGPKSAVVV